MSRRISTAIVLSLLLAATAALGLEEGEVGLAAEVGLAHAVGGLGDDARDNFALGANLSYGVFDWLAFEMAGHYSAHTEQDTDRVGDLSLTLLHASAGPRFSLGLSFVSFWLSVGGGVTVYRAEVKFDTDAGKQIKDDESGAAPMLAGAAGVDFQLADIFALGISGRIHYGLSDIDYASPSGTREVPPIVVMPLLRASLWF